VNRRSFLAGVVTCAAATLAGCAGPGARLDVERVSDAALAERASQSTANAPDEIRGLVAEAVENGSATAEGRAASFDPDRPVAFEGEFYEVTRTVVDERDERSWTVEVDYDSSQTDGPTIALADLPDVDREVLSSVIPPSGDPPESDGPDLGVSNVYGSEGEGQSVLVPEQQYEFVTHEGEYYGLSVEGPSTVTVRTYRFETDLVAASADEYAAQVRDDYLFVLDGLSDAEREIVADAIDGGYHAEEPTDAFASLEARFREHPGFGVGEYAGEWVVRYEGATYWADLHDETG
jgi:hypothetical protein